MHLTLLKIQNMMDVNVGLFQRFISFFDKKSSGGRAKNQIILNKKLAEELHKPIIRKSDKSRLSFYRQYLGCRSCRYAIDKFNKGFRFLLFLLTFIVNMHVLFL